MSNSFAHVLCTTSSATSAIGTTAEYIFNTGHGSVAYSSKTSRDITWDQSLGTFTFSKPGIYHVVLTAITSQVTSSRIQTTTFNLNDASSYATKVDAIDLDSFTTGTDRITITVPAAAGGAGTAVAIALCNDTDGSTSAGSGVIGIGTSGASAGTVAETVVDAINGYTSSGGTYNHSKANLGSGTSASGIAGVTAFLSGTTKVTLRATSKHIRAYDIRVANAAGDAAEAGFFTEDDIYTGSIFVNKDMDPVEATHQRIIAVKTGDRLQLQIKTGGDTMGVGAGTSLTITEVDSGVYASSTVTTAGSNSTTSEFNPLDTDGDGPTFASGGKIASGITFSGAAGSMTVPVAGKYLIMITNFHSAGSVTNSDIEMKLKSGSDTIYTGSSRNNSTVDPIESTIFVIESLAASAVLTLKWDIGSGTCFADVGTTFSIYRLIEGTNTNPSPRKRGQDLYASVVSKMPITATGAAVNPFDEDSYTVPAMTA